MFLGWLKSAVIVCIFAVTLAAQSRQDVVKKLESASVLRDWKLVGEPEDYDTSSIDTFTQAPLPVLKLFGVRGARVLRWDTGRGRVQLSLFEMIDSPAAYGVFTAIRPASAKPTPVVIGAGSFQSASLCFWQSVYAVCIDGPQRAQNDLAVLVSEQILGPSQKPPVNAHLPPAHMIAGSDRYHLSLESVPNVRGLDRNQLGFENSVEAASGDYSVNGSSAHLLLLHYPTQHLARKFEEELNKANAPGFRKRDGPLLAIVHGTTDPAVASAILDGVDLEYAVTYDETNPVTTYAQMIVAIIKLTGALLLITVGAGIAYGGLRVLVKKWFPDRVFDRPQDVEIIQLKLDESLTRKQIRE